MVIGAGLAGCEAAWQLAQRGVKVTLAEQKPSYMSPAHHSPGFAELVCSNSLKAERLESAAGLLKEEMAIMGSLLVKCARKCRVPAGGALAVDRDDFSAMVTAAVRSHENISVVERRVEAIPMDVPVIIATGPLTGGALAQAITAFLGEDTLSFYDAAAPIVTADSLDMDCAFLASRYDKGEDDAYINCPMDKEQYEAFHRALVEAQTAPLHDFDRPVTVYEGCMPIEIMAKRGADTIRYGPLKPVGLRDPKTGKRPWAVVQLRRENSSGALYNLVGFQTNLKFPEQKRVFSMVPALKNAEFVRYGVMHRNSFLNSPALLNADFSCRRAGNVYFAGQMTGVEGYMESGMSGLLAGSNLSRRLAQKEPLILSRETMCGALAAYISDPTVTRFQPMGANFGILPAMEPHIRDKKERYRALALRALEVLKRTDLS